jgi:hypothetical protein
MLFSHLRRPGFLSHLRSLAGYDEPETLRSQDPSNRLAIADGGHHWATRQNIARFTERLKGTLSESERRLLERLLAEEKQRLRDAERDDSGGDK